MSTVRIVEFTGGGYVSAFRTFWVKLLEAGECKTYKNKKGKSICSSGNATEDSIANDLRSPLLPSVG